MAKNKYRDICAKVDQAAEDLEKANDIVERRIDISENVSCETLPKAQKSIS